MSKLSDIPVVVESGQKYTTAEGVVAIKDGIKNRDQSFTRLPKPSWLRMKVATTDAYSRVKEQVKEHRLATVCEEAKCPNIAECWSHGTATIMLMGAVCTRACRFCAVDTGNPHGWLDPDEVENTAKTVELMNLDYVVLTSVNRDDLPDGGAAHYAAAITAIKKRSPKTRIEALTPDFQGVHANIDILLASGLDVFAQNVETVERLTHPVRCASIAISCVADKKVSPTANAIIKPEEFSGENHAIVLKPRHNPICVINAQLRRLPNDPNV
jgi:lipoic acid synthetase